MSEQTPINLQRGGDGPPPSKRLRELCTAADPVPEPYDELRRRVAEMATYSTASAVRDHQLLISMRVKGWVALAATIGLLLLTFAGFKLGTSVHDRSGRSTVARSVPTAQPASADVRSS